MGKNNNLLLNLGFSKFIKDILMNFDLKSIPKPVLIIGVSLFLQVVLGILTLLSGVKIIYASLHQINSILIILSTLYFLYLAKYRKIN